MENKQFYIQINGANIEVSEELYREYYRPEWAERKRREREKRCRDNNGNRCMEECRLCDKKRNGGILSLDGLLSEGGYEVADSTDIADVAAEKVLIDELRNAVANLSNEERQIIGIAYSGKPEREAAEELGLPRKTFTYRRDKILSKLKKDLGV